MQKSNVTVLGTSFNIDISSTEVNVGVKTGRVFFSPYLSNVSAILSAGQGLTYNIPTKEIINKTAQNSDSWLTNELVFVDTPLEDVCRQLSTYYRVNIKLVNSSPSVKKLNATFKNQSLNEVLNVLTTIYSIKINSTNNQINLIVPSTNL